MNKSVMYLGLLVTLCLLVCVQAFAKKQKAGEIKNGWYSDIRFGFSVAIVEDWKEAGIKDEPTSERLSLVWRKARTPIKLKDNPNEAVKPFVKILADSTQLTPAAFLDSLNNGVTTNEFRDKIIVKSIFFYRGVSNQPEISSPEPVKIGGRSAYRWSIRREYSVQIWKNDYTPPQLVRDYRIGYVYIIPGDGYLIYIEMACENQFRDEMEPKFQEVASSITFHSTAVEVDSAAASSSDGE